MSWVNWDDLSDVEKIAQVLGDMRPDGHMVPYETRRHIEQWIHLAPSFDALLLIIAELSEKDLSAKGPERLNRKVLARLSKAQPTI